MDIKLEPSDIKLEVPDSEDLTFATRRTCSETELKDNVLGLNFVKEEVTENSVKNDEITENCDKIERTDSEVASGLQGDEVEALSMPISQVHTTQSQGTNGVHHKPFSNHLADSLRHDFLAESGIHRSVNMHTIKLEPLDINPEISELEYLKLLVTRGTCTGSEVKDNAFDLNFVKNKIIENSIKKETTDSESASGLLGHEATTSQIDQVAKSQRLGEVNYRHAGKRANDITPGGLSCNPKVVRVVTSADSGGAMRVRMVRASANDEETDTADMESTADRNRNFGASGETNAMGGSKDDKKCFICVRCKKRFQDESSQNAHFENEHKMLTCYFCDLKFTTLSLRLRHYRDRHPVASENICNVCNIVFEHRNMLLRHCHKVHLKNTNIAFKTPDPTCNSNHEESYVNGIFESSEKKQLVYGVVALLTAFSLMKPISI